jgi:hypothetical protein
MSVRPVLLKDIRRDAVNSHQTQVGTGSYNRWTPLVSRDRIVSHGKRPLSGSDDDASNTKNPRLDRNIVFEQVRGQEPVLKELKTLIAVMDDKPDKPEGHAEIWRAFGMMAKIQEGLMSAIVDIGATEHARTGHTGAGSGSGAAAGGGSGPGQKATGGGIQKKGPPPTASPADNEQKKMKQVLKDAEKKLVVFNLNLGKAPVMNRDTLAKNVALDLDTRVKNGKHDFHLGDAVEVIDDLLSCSKLDFMGTSTRKYYNTRNPNDPLNEKMYTMPVKMEFKDRDVRTQAEISLRKICHVNCAVPYPKSVRNVLDTLITEGKKKYPNSFIRTRVNIDDLTAEAFASVDKKWVDTGLKLSIMDRATGTGAGAGDVFVEPVPATASQSTMDCGESQQIS